MKREKWQDACFEKRYAVYKVYSKWILMKEGYTVTWEQCDFGWRDSWWDIIYYTFGIAENLA